jgi:hypothetical protein
MATGTLAPLGRQTFFDTNGDPLSLGSLETYLAGTSTAVATYSNVTLTVANPTTITLNAAGRPSVSGTEVALFLTPGLSYKFIVKNAAGSTIWTQDNISAIPAATVDLDITGTAGEALTAGEVVYLSDGTGALTAGRWYRADADNAYSSSTAGMIGMVPASIASGDSGAIRISGRVTGLGGLTAGITYYVSATAGALTATAPSHIRFVGVADSTTSIIIAPVAAQTTVQRGPQGRLTLTSGTAVTSGDVTAATTIYFTPYQGARAWLYTGSAWAEHVFTERSLSLAGLAADTNFDVFLYNNAGTLTLETTAWTNATTRATALVLQDGLLVRTGATTRLYLGTIRTTGTIGQTEDSLAKRFVWNNFNRVPRELRVLEATNSWTYTTATYRQANAAAANQLAMVIGLAESVLHVQVGVEFGQVETVRVAVGEDSTSVPMPASVGRSLSQGGGARGAVWTAVDVRPAIGYHFYTWLEHSTASGTTTWYGDDGGTTTQSGITGILWGA